jgi:1-acyl-sn-glycerol-3-phosphate acyltransferase
MNKFRAAARGILVAALMASHVAPAVVKALVSGVDMRLALRMRRLWARRSLRVLGVQVDRTGRLPTDGPFIIAGNHRSYLDPIIALKEVEALPVAKAEVGSWPLIGFAAKATGIMYVKRDSRDSRAATLDAMEKILKEGYSVLVYPEGTTHIEPVTRRFKPGAFRLAAAMEVPIVPVVVEYEKTEDAWIGTDTFVPHFVRTFGRKETFVKIRYGDPIVSNDSAVLIAATKKWIDENLIKIRSEFDAGKTSTA